MVEETGGAVPDSHPLLSAVQSGTANTAAAEDSLASSQVDPGALTEGQAQEGL